MRKGQRPSRHTRVIKTKRGRRRITINKHIFKKRPRGTIKPIERKMFKHISNPKNYNKEYGGAIDFDLKGNIENINIVPGTMYEVDVPVDYEVQYHTHPSKFIDPPSPEDVTALIKSKNQQAEIVFRDGKAFQIIKTPSTKALSRLSATQLIKKFRKAFQSLQHTKNFEQNWKEYLESLGFVVFINNNPKKSIKVRIKPVEPKKKGRRSIWDS